jgi:hypothetical protein
VIDITVDCNTRTYPLDDQLHDFEDSITIMNFGLDTIANLDRSRRLGRLVVHLHVAAAAGRRRVATRLGHPDRPQPLIHSSRFDPPPSHTNNSRAVTPGARPLVLRLSDCGDLLGDAVDTATTVGENCADV